MNENEFESVDNIKLLEDNLVHLKFELERTNTSYFRVAKEAHQALYRSMVEALRGSANLAITGRPKDKNRTVKYQRGNAPWMEIYKTEVEGCKKAWRYSDPMPCDPPERKAKDNSYPQPIENYLKSFYDLLSKIQTICFMGRYVMSKPIEVTDRELQYLEWLHENIRNEFEHFIPKLYLTLIEDLKNVSLICLQKTNKLIFESGNIIPSFDPEDLKNLMADTVLLLNK